MFAFLSCFGTRPASLSLPPDGSMGGSMPEAPQNSLADEEPVEVRWDMLATALLVFRLYSYKEEMREEWEREQLAWLTEQYGSWVERVLFRLRGF